MIVNCQAQLVDSKCAHTRNGGEVMPWNWSDQGIPPSLTVDGDAIAAISYDSRPYVFVRASNGRLWVNWWS